MRITCILVGLVATACTGTITTGIGGDDDAPPPPVTDVQLVVHDGATPQAGLRVVFQNADGSPIAEATTDATGLASAEMPNGGNVTVIRTFPPVAGTGTPPNQVYTYVGVKSGDRLQLGRPIDTLGTPTAIVVKVPDAAQGTVVVATPCGSGEGTAPNVPITIAGCPSDMTFYVSDQNQSSFAAHAPMASNIDLSLSTLTGSLSTSFSSTNVTPDVNQVDVEARVVTGTFTMFSSGPKRVDAQPATVNLPNLTGVDELVVATIQATAGTQMVSTRRPYAVTPTSVDASAGLIPYVGDPTLPATPTALTWTETGTGTADFVIASLDVTRGGAQTGTEYIRTIIAPYTAGTLTLPTLTGADAIYNPTKDDSVAATHGIAKVTGGYDALRATAFSVANIVELAGMNGGVTLSYSGNNPPALQ